jgi:hypothetical protein
MMRAVLVLVVVLAACDHRPPPPPSAKPEPAAEPAAAPEPAPAAAPAPAATPPDAAPAVIGEDLARANAAQFKACTDAATHTVDVMIAAAPAVNRPELEAQRTDVINGMRDPCVQNKWSAAAIACLNASTDQPSIEKCRALLP